MTIPRPLPIALALALTSYAPAAAAQTASAPAAPVADDTVRLTDEQRLAILDQITPESAAAARGELPGSSLASRGVHGEIGVVIGSHGTRGVYGAAEIPLGDNASATVRYENFRTNVPRYPR